MRLLKTLEDLDDENLEKFKFHLCRAAIKKGLPRIPYDNMMMAGRNKTVMLMVETYGEQSLELTSEVLQHFDLLQRFSDMSLGSKGKTLRTILTLFNFINV